MNKLNLIWSVLIASTMVFVGCSKDSEIDGGNSTVAGTGTLAINVKSVGNGSTRAASGTDAATADESAITNYEVFVYASLTDGSAPVAYKALSNGSSTVLTDVPAGVSSVVVVANYDAVLGSSITYSELTAKLSSKPYTIASSGVAAGNASVTKTTGFEMTGVASATIVANSNNTTTVSVIRLVSKHNEPTINATKLSYKEGVTDLSTLSQLFGENVTENDLTQGSVSFAKSGYALINGRVESALFEDSATPTDGFTYWASAFDAAGSGAYANNYTAAGFLGFATSETDPVPVYAFENTPVGVYDDTELVGFDASSVYAFIIEGQLTFNNATVTRYWRVNLVKDSGFVNEDGTPGSYTVDNFKIYRNGSYYVTIGNVYSAGYETPEEAEEENENVVSLKDPTTLSVTLEVKDWDLYETTTDM